VFKKDSNWMFWAFENSDFEFVSDLGFRASDLFMFFYFIRDVVLVNQKNFVSKANKNSVELFNS
jgi:hypothetical protein